MNPPRRVRQEMKALTPEQARQFLEAAAKTPLEAFYVLAITTGMRFGELLALKWRDVDLEGRSAQVRATVQRLQSSLAFSEPKSARSRLDTPPAQGGRCSGDAQPTGSRGRLRGLPGCRVERPKRVPVRTGSPPRRSSRPPANKGNGEGAMHPPLESRGFLALFCKPTR